MPKLSASLLYPQLVKAYKPPRTFLEFRTPLDLLVATMLSAQCTDARVNLTTKTILYPKYKTAKDYVKVPQSELEKDIKSCGFYRAKAKNIQGMCRILIEKHGGNVPQTMDELTHLPGVGRKTAAIILWAAYGKNEGIAVDTHVLRVSQRLGLTKQKDPKKIELDLMKQFPKKNWGRVTTLIISHARAVCTARNRGCDRCMFAKSCPSSLTTGQSDKAAPKKKRRPSLR